MLKRIPEFGRLWLQRLAKKLLALPTSLSCMVSKRGTLSILRGEEIIDVFIIPRHLPLLVAFENIKQRISIAPYANTG